MCTHYVSVFAFCCASGVRVYRLRVRVVQHVLVLMMVLGSRHSSSGGGGRGDGGIGGRSKQKPRVKMVIHDNKFYWIYRYAAHAYKTRFARRDDNNGQSACVFVCVLHGAACECALRHIAKCGSVSYSRRRRIFRSAVDVANGSCCSRKSASQT